MVIDPNGINDLVSCIQPEEDKNQRQGYQAPQSSQRLRRIALGR